MRKNPDPRSLLREAVKHASPARSFFRKKIDIMSNLSGSTCPTRHEDFTEQIRERRKAITTNSLKLEEVQKQRLRVEQETMLCTRETERRAELMMANSGVVDVLQQLGHLLQEERRLSQQLNGQAPEDRNQQDDLEERSERLTNKARSLTAEILEVKQRLAEAKDRNKAAEALIHTPTSTPK
ncbi:putative PERQ amino acid-rich with GYF domain-containing protein 2-like isoform 2 [Scophthalmus maximus]|uniref:Putative PERQ amino acid-rich with GYF domain-containing protein 2-like isoform 2 n=1 Tax=Scophthalmus maximus TaxID=52904 RepID=A0A2U9C8U2_SCOMX|nr:putative PERQ amino acid-rich with GYF domain-containing protein 2-like isoform 2 [Scophthalmus maximus]